MNNNLFGTLYGYSPRCKPPTRLELAARRYLNGPGDIELCCDERLKISFDWAERMIEEETRRSTAECVNKVRDAAARVVGKIHEINADQINT